MLFRSGDDYELLFTAAPQRAAQVASAGDSAGVAVTRIGRIIERPDAGRVQLIDAQGRAVQHDALSFDHFRT